MQRMTGPVPNLVIAQRVIDKISQVAQEYTEDETGEAMIGFLEPGINTGGIPTIYVMDTISPDDSAVRELHTFQQGDALQDELIWWLQENWHERRQIKDENNPDKLPSKWNIPLRYLGDWHKQPGFMIAPSGGDRMTAMDWLMEEDPEDGMGFLLVPIVTLGHPSTSNGAGITNYVVVPREDGDMRIDWWIIFAERGVFQPLAPSVYPDDQLPSIVTEYPWHLKDDARFSIEVGQIEHDERFVSTAVLWNTDGKLPLEVCFITARKGAGYVLLIATPYNYPDAPPRIYTAPFKLLNLNDGTYEMFGKLWEHATEITDQIKLSEDSMPDDPESTYLLDYVHAAENLPDLQVAQVPDNPVQTVKTDNTDEEVES